MFYSGGLKFGFEFEFTGISREAAFLVLCKVLERKNPGPELGSCEISDQDFSFLFSNGFEWKIVRDSSIDPIEHDRGVVLTDFISDDFSNELVTPILSYTEKDLSVLEDVILSLRLAGALVTTSCGIHVHVGVGDELSRDVRFLKNLCIISYIRGPFLMKLLGVHSVRETYCKPISKKKINLIDSIPASSMSFEEFKLLWYRGFKSKDSVREYESRRQTRYSFINLHPLLSGKRQAIEFRGYNSTFDLRAIRSYIQLSFLIVAQAKRQKYILLKELHRDDEQELTNWLRSLGATGREYKDLRELLYAGLEKEEDRSYDNFFDLPIPF